MALHQIHRPMPFAAGTTAIGFAALAGAFRERAAQEPFAGGEVGDAGTETALGNGEFCAAERSSHVLYQYYTRHAQKTRAETQCEYASESTVGQNNNQIRCFGHTRKSVAESLGVPSFA